MKGGTCRLGAKSRMAVPFTAAEKPNERAEFKQPDKAILATKRAKYADGLCKEKVRALLAKLQDLLPSQQEGQYRCASPPASTHHAGQCKASFEDTNCVRLCAGRYVAATALLVVQHLATARHVRMTSSVSTIGRFFPLHTGLVACLS